MPASKRFRAKIVKRGSSALVDVPEAVSRAFASQAVGGRIRFDGKLNRVAVRGTLIPAGQGRHVLYVNGGMRSAAGVGVGDTVTFEIRAAAAGTVRAPADLAAALRRVKGARAAWDALPPSHRRELLRYVDDARTEATRARRLEKTVAHALGKPAARGRSTPAVVKRDLWTCPRCGHQFVNRNQWHACRRVDVDAAFTGKPPFIRALFDRFRGMVESLGPVTLVPYHNRVGFMVRVRFAGAIPMKRWLEVGFWLPRRIDHPRMYKIETLYPDVHIHRLRVTRKDELDDELLEWLREAYAVGCQEPLAAAV
ncbi:MAG: YdeI/OmpD-associated family protein [bacterium]